MAAIPGLPGLDSAGQSDPTPLAASTTLTRDLPPHHEFRFETPTSSTSAPTIIKLTAGTAELFGTELTKNIPYTFSSTKSAIYTTTGCTLQLSGSLPEVEYTAEETPMSTYLNLHIALEKARSLASDCPPTAEGAQGPRVLIIGPSSVGKTTLTKILTGYAIRQGRRPMVINLNVGGEGMLSLPGTISAAGFGSVMDVEEGFGTSPMSGPSAIPVKLPLVYYYGLEGPEGGLRRYKRLASRVAMAVNGRLEEDSEAKNTGLLLDTPPLDSHSPQTTDLLTHLISDFAITTIAVLGSERLYNTTLRFFSSQGIAVINLPTSGGVIDRSPSFKKSQLHHSIKSYFFGNEPGSGMASGGTLSPYTATIELDPANPAAFALFEVVDHSSSGGSGSSGAGNTSFLPIGEDDPSLLGLAGADGDDDLRRVSATEVDSRFENVIVAVVHADAHPLGGSGGQAEKAVLKTVGESTVLGFLYVQEVDEKTKRMKVLSPVPGRVPQGRALVVGKWPGAMFLT